MGKSHLIVKLEAEIRRLRQENKELQEENIDLQVKNSFLEFLARTPSEVVFPTPPPTDFFIHPN